MFIITPLKPTIQIDNNKSLIKDATKYVCCILLGKNYLSYALCDAGQSIIYSVKHFSFENKVISKKDFNEILSDAVFKEVSLVKIGIDTLKTTLVPEEYFQAESKVKYLEAFFEISVEEEIHTYSVSNTMRSVFSLKKTTVQFLTSILPKVHFFDASACLLKSYPLLVQSDLPATVCIGVKPDFCLLSLYVQKQLVHHQVYPECTSVDILFYVQQVLLYYKVGAEECQFYLHGETTELQQLFTLMTVYFPQVKFCPRVGNMEFPEGIYSQPSHYFFNLFSLATCE